MLALVRYLPEKTNFAFMRWRYVSFAISGFLILASIVLFFAVGPNYGIDFRGGTMIEIQATSGRADIADVRRRIERLGMGDVQVQEFGTPAELMVRIGATGEREAAAAVERVRQALVEGYTIRQTQSVGPAVSGELVTQSIIALSLGVLAIFAYLWFRFEWQFALGAIVTTMHDIFLTVGLYVILQIDFDLTAIAAILTIMGYSLNDTVVIYDRIRDMLRKYKQMPLEQLLDTAINATFSRTIIVAATTFFATVALYFFGGEVLRGFSIAMLFGVVVGTFSTIYVASPILIHLNLRTRSSRITGEAAPAKSGKPAKARP